MWVGMSIGGVGNVGVLGVLGVCLCEFGMGEKSSGSGC